MKTLLKILMIAVLGLMAPLCMAQSVSKDTVLLEIINGDTAFAVDVKRGNVWWLVGECRREIPMPDKATSASQGVMQSQRISEEVLLGQRQVVLEQQFRFNLTSIAGGLDGPASVEVYNSVRGGWAQIPVTLKQNCSQDAVCSQRVDVPDC